MIPIDEYDVKRILREERDKQGSGCLVTLVWFVMGMFMLYTLMYILADIETRLENVEHQLNIEPIHQPFLPWERQP